MRIVCSLVTSPRALPPHATTVRFEIQHMNVGGTQTLKSTPAGLLKALDRMFEFSLVHRPSMLSIHATTDRALVDQCEAGEGLG